MLIAPEPLATHPATWGPTREDSPSKIFPQEGSAGTRPVSFIPMAAAKVSFLWLAFSAEGHILVYPRVSLLGDQCTFNHMREAFDEGLLNSALILSQQHIFSSNCHTHTHIHVHMPGSVS